MSTVFPLVALPLTAEQIHKLITLTQEERVVEFDNYIVKRRISGYSADRETAALQAALSVMLEVAIRAKERP